MSTPTPLPTVVKFNGFTLTQIKRTDKGAIYHQSGASGDATAYEVVRIVVLPEMEIMGRKYSLRESYPSMHDWGTLGWTYTGPNGLKLAEKKLEELT